MDAVAKAGEFFAAQGREFDKARFAYHFAGGSVSAIMTELAKYQNSDGGISGLEVDIKAADSNPFATELALMACLQADVPRDDAVLWGIVDYLERTQDEDSGWPSPYSPDWRPWTTMQNLLTLRAFGRI